MSRNISTAEFDSYVTPKTRKRESEIRGLIKNIRKNRAEIDRMVDIAIHDPDDEVSWWGKAWLWNLSMYYVRGLLSDRMGDLCRKKSIMEDVTAAAKEKILSEADTYDSSRGSILTFARGRALHAMTTEINFQMAKTSDYFAGNMKTVKKARDMLLKDEKPVTLIALVSMTGLQPKKVEDALDLLERTTQMQWEAIENESYIASTNPETKLLEQELSEELHNAIDALPDDCRLCILIKYGLMDDSDIKTIKEMKELMSRPQNQIRELTATALKMLGENRKLAALRGAELKKQKRLETERMEPSSISRDTEYSLMMYFKDDDDEDGDGTEDADILDGIAVMSEDDMGRNTVSFNDVQLTLNYMDRFLQG